MHQDEHYIAQLSTVKITHTTKEIGKWLTGITLLLTKLII